METLLIKDAALLATFDEEEREIPSGSVLIEGNRIIRVFAPEELEQGLPALGYGEPDRTIDARNHVVLPGLVNTHHHFYQTLTRNAPAGQNAGLFDWLVAHYPIWARMDRDALYWASQVAAAELLLSGCTTASDHTYMWPNGASIDDEIAAVSEMGLRFHVSRGSMSVGIAHGGLPPDDAVEEEEAILADTRRAIEEYLDPNPYAMTRVVVAPCSPFSVSHDLMRESAHLARAYGVQLHTHLAETADEDRFCKERFGLTPVGYAESVEWSGGDVWFAHMVHPSQDEITRLGADRCGAAHCPSSNMRLGSGIAPLRAMQQAGMRVGLGVDGSASNDSSHMLGETRQALLLQRLTGHMGFTARDALRLATRGGADVLGRSDIGRIAPGAAADLIGIRTDALGLAGGAIHDPLAALVFCHPQTVDFALVNGALRVWDGALAGVELEPVIERHNRAAMRMLEA
jgi:cytosine/adenosine deaminase-related metal-dependent hydrolase